jgi:outer membrane protein assembly factor BamB
MAILYALLFFWMPEDWSQFRGPNADGHVQNDIVPEKWSDTESVVWKVSIPGLGWSSPVIVDGRIYLTTAVSEGEGLSLRTLCLNSENGSVVWDKEIRKVDKAPSIHTKNSHASPTPIIYGDSLFVHFGALGTARLKRANGELEWFSNELDYPPLHGSGGSPFLADGKLVVVCDGSVKPFVAALDASTGKVAWKTFRSVEARISHSFVTPIVA